MAIVIVSSFEDPAGTNITSQLQKLSSWHTIDSFNNQPVYASDEFSQVLLTFIDDRTIFHEHLDKELQSALRISIDTLVIASRHTSKKGIPTLTVHPIGNYGNADFGGRSHTLVPAAPVIMTSLLRNIKTNTRNSNLDHQVCFEVTHHGPLVSVPTVYIEIGSTEVEWKRFKPAEVIAQSILDFFIAQKNGRNLQNHNHVLIGIGGGHYAPRFSDVAFQKKVVFGHMIPSYQVNAGNILEDILEKTVQSTPRVSGVYFHKKALRKSWIHTVSSWFTDKGIAIVSSKDLPDL